MICQSWITFFLIHPVYCGMTWSEPRLKMSADLKIDCMHTRHLLLKIEAGVIGPTFFYFTIQNHIFCVFIPLHPYNKYTWNKNAQNVIYNVIYLLK